MGNGWWRAWTARAQLFKIPMGPAARERGGNQSRVVPDGRSLFTRVLWWALPDRCLVRPDGTLIEAPVIRVRVGTERYRFLPGRQELVYVPTTSQVAPQNFWLLDLATKKSRQLANIDSSLTRTFDVTPDGKQIVFDRLRENSDIVLIDLPAKP
jgi:hypothetical protein